MDHHVLHNRLAALPLCCDLEQEHVEEISKRAKLIQLARNETLFRTGDKLGGCFCIISGLVKLTIVAPSGQEKVIELLGKGRSFGESNLFLDSPTPVTAEAVDNTTIALIPRDLILDHLVKNAEFTRRMLAGLSHRLHYLISDLEACCLHAAMQRVASFLLYETEEVSRNKESLTVKLRSSKTLVASKLGLTPSTLSRILHELDEDGLIRVEGRYIEVLDPAYMRELSHGMQEQVGPDLEERRDSGRR